MKMSCFTVSELDKMKTNPIFKRGGCVFQVGKKINFSSSVGSRIAHATSQSLDLTLAKAINTIQAQLSRSNSCQTSFSFQLKPQRVPKPSGAELSEFNVTKGNMHVRPLKLQLLFQWMHMMKLKTYLCNTESVCLNTWNHLQRFLLLNVELQQIVHSLNSFDD